MAENNKFPREIYKKIKKMDNEQLCKFFHDFYMNGKEDAYEEIHGLIKLDKLREQIGSVKGIGAARLDDIMTVIETYINNIFSEGE